MGIVRNLKKEKENRKNKDEVYASYMNFILYGVTGKSYLAGALSKFVDKPVLMLSPSGGSELVEEEYENVVSYPINNLDELIAIYQDLHSDLRAIRGLRDAIRSNDKKRLELAKKHYGEEYEEIHAMAKANELPISAIVVEECSIISNWIQHKLEDELEVNYIGEDKGARGIDWNKLSREVMEVYTKFLRLPVTTILSTGYIDPTEKEKATRIKPDLSQGSASRKLVDLVGNLFYCYKTEDQKYMVQIVDDKKVQCKDKLLPVGSKVKLQKEVDITNNPESFWEYINALSERKVIKTKK